MRIPNFRFVPALLALSVLAVPSWAFKAGAHMATGNLMLDQLKTVPAQTPFPLVFDLDGRKIETGVTNQEALQAILAWPDFFRGGLMGPDVYPDPITGQAIQHSDRMDLLQDKNSAFTGFGIMPDNPRITPEKNYEERYKLSQRRSIDHAMGMLKYSKDFPRRDLSNSNAQAQELAFIMGYFGHCIGDGFVHQFINVEVRGAWDYVEGGWQFGTLSEEVRHVVTEGWIDKNVPGVLQNADGTQGGEYDRYSIRAPIIFLDAWFSSQVTTIASNSPKKSAEGESISLGDPTKDWQGFLKYYSNIDQYQGGPIYNYLNAQVAAAEDLENWTGTKKYVDLANSIAPNGTMDEIAKWYQDLTLQNPKIKKFIREDVQGDALDAITMGYLDCNTAMPDLDGPSFYRIFSYFTGFKKRISQHRELAELARKNWLVLSECTGANMARLAGDDYDSAKPTLNHDACRDFANLAEQDKFAEENGGVGIFHGSIDPKDATNRRTIWLKELIASFKYDGQDGILHNGPEFQATSRHRTFGGNISRMQNYLLHTGFTLDQLEDVLIPKEHKQDWKLLCETVRDHGDNGKRHCVNLKLLPASLLWNAGTCGSAQLECLDKAAAAASSCYITECALSSAIVSTCEVLAADVPGTGMPIDCRDDGWYDVEYARFCPYTGVNCVPCTRSVQENCKDLARGALNAANISAKCSNWQDLQHCNPIEDIERSYDYFMCTTHGAINCAEDDLHTIFLQQGVADGPMDAIAEVCDAVDQAKAFMSDYSTVQKRRDFVERHGFPIEQYDQTLAAWKAVGDMMRTWPPNAQMNFVFLEFDLQDPAWRNQISTSVDAWIARDNLMARPADDDARVAALRLKSLITQAQQGQNTTWITYDDIKPGQMEGSSTTEQDGTVKIDLATDLNAAKREALVMQQVVSSPVFRNQPDGPTAKHIRAEMGASLSRDFHPFFNTVQGLKLLILNNQADINALFVQQGVDTKKLPWGSEGTNKYSAICRDTRLTNLFCDVIASLDDPDCMSCAVDPAKGVDSFYHDTDPAWDTWWGRGVTPWNAKGRVGYGGKDHSFTPFPLAASEDAWQKLYTKIFRVPGRLPSFFSLDKASEWTSDAGVQLVSDPVGDQSAGSLRVEGAGWHQITSSVFRTSDLGALSGTMAVDVYVPQSSANPYWPGTLGLSVNVPGGGVNSADQGSCVLKTGSNGNWQTCTFTLSAAVQKVFDEDWDQATISLILNTPGALPGDGYKLDNLRFTGELHSHTGVHQSAPSAPSTALDLESGNGWTSESGAPIHWVTSIQSPTGIVGVQSGSEAAAISGGGYQVLSNTGVPVASLGTVTSQLGIDIWVPDPLPNPYWTGALQIFASVPEAGLTDVWVGQADLSKMFHSDWNPLAIQVPSALQTALINGRTLKLRVALNTANGASTFLLDNLRFVGTP